MAAFVPRSGLSLQEEPREGIIATVTRWDHDDRPYQQIGAMYLLTRENGELGIKVLVELGVAELPARAEPQRRRRRPAGPPPVAVPSRQRSRRRTTASVSAASIRKRFSRERAPPTSSTDDRADAELRGQQVGGGLVGPVVERRRRHHDLDAWPWRPTTALRPARGWTWTDSTSAPSLIV